jgi:hypothetical protein
VRRRRPTAGKAQVQTEDSGALDASARRVLAAHGGDASPIEALSRDLRHLVAFQEASPDPLGEYRRTSRELAAAQRAFAA